jgi:hypothetical protein
MTNQLLWFSKLTPIPLTIDEDDLMTEKKHHTLRLKSGNYFDEWEKKMFISATKQENLKSSENAYMKR